MHAWHEKYKMICHVQKRLTDNDLMHAQKSWRQGKCISNLIRFFFYIFFSIESHYLDPSLFKQTFFCKRKTSSLFLIIFNMVFYFFYSRQDLFFVLKKTNKTSIFLIFFIQNETLSYCEKKMEWKIIFFCIFS